ncbi:MAG: hypothetical protein M3O71_21250 [Bacteroidota bacterium]|nr:hypothetical protein [Bacteroidota bacterium]
MQTSDELIGTLALVHPQLPNDPAGKQGQVGIITDANLKNETIEVRFGKNGKGIYGTDALLLLRPAEQLKRNLELHKQELNESDYKTLFNISLLQEFKQSTANIKSAMSLALQSEAVRNLSMYTFEEALGLRRNQHLQR